MWYKCSFLHDKVAVQQTVDFNDLLFNSIFWDVIVLILLYFKKWAGLQFLISKLETQEYVQNSQQKLLTGTGAANFTSNRSGTLECAVNISANNNNVPKHENSLTQKMLVHNFVQTTLHGFWSSKFNRNN